MATEYDDSRDYAFFIRDSLTLTNGNGFATRWSSQTAAALRAIGFLDNMVDGTVPPIDTSMLWLDKNSDPAVLKEWNPVGAAWEKVTSQTLFGRVPWRGPWSSSPIYRKGDLVSFNGDIWIAVLPSQNHAPAEDAFWDLFIDSSAPNSVDTAALQDGAVTRPKLSSPVRTTLWRRSLAEYGAVGDGTTDDTAAVVAALAAGVPLTGARKVFAISGKISLPAGADLEDAEFKQLAPGAALNVVTLEASGVDRVRLVRVKVNRNGDGTNGGLLNGSGINGALNSAFGMAFINCSSSHFEDLEVYGNDSGTGILFRKISETSKVIRPYVHDIIWARTAATDDQVQGIWFDQCTRLPVFNPRVINLTGVLNGVSTRRFTRGIPLGGCVGVTLYSPYVERADQGVDITGGPATNRDICVIGGVVKDIYVWGVKLANTARRCKIVLCRAYDCGVGFVASANPSLTSDITTDRSEFIDCTAYNTGASGQTVAAVAGFRVLEDAATAAGRARNIRFVRCKAIDEQTVKTMTYGFSSEITDVSVAPIMIDCESVGHATAATNGTFRSANGVGIAQQTSGLATGAVIETGGAVATGVYTKYADGTMIISAIIDDAAAAWTTAAGALFIRTALLSFNWPVAFVGNVPVVTASANRGDSAIACGVNVRDAGLTSVNLMPWISASLASGNAKTVHVQAVGRWF